MAELGPILCPKCEADEERKKIGNTASPAYSTITDCNSLSRMREMFLGFLRKGLILNKSEKVDNCWIPKVENIPSNFNWDFSTRYYFCTWYKDYVANTLKVPSGVQQLDVYCNLLFPGGCSCPSCSDIKEIVGSNAQFVLKDIAGREVTARQDTLFLSETIKKAKERDPVLFSSNCMRERGEDINRLWYFNW
ncbi:hypothetical protein BDZ91DRAFT_768017 [Kalaharituber pfeilii]|nr:hypothetical protein BDZ91DRAFT_768017 [Kalaharituber pfeilii]